jgi:uncharacterized protein (TIGR02391 family)
MPKRRDYPDPKPPTFSLSEGKQRPQAMRERGVNKLQNRPLGQSDLETWSNTALGYIEQTFGEDSRHRSTFAGQVMIRMNDDNTGYDAYTEQQDAEKLADRVKVLENLIDIIDQELSFAAPQPAIRSEDFWNRLHPSIVHMSRSRFEAGHYADAVEAAFKELNTKLKAYVQKATGQEFDGADLTNRAFSLSNPIARLADLSTEDGKNIQKGYMQIFAGAMTGIRNPKAHSNVTIDASRAIHHLHLASLLHYIFDERL